MRKVLTAAVVCCGIMVIASRLQAERASEIKPLLVKPGKLVLEERFGASELPKGWAVAKGDWQVKDGAVLGKEKKSDMHAAVLNLQQPFKNTLLRFSFKREGASGVNLSFNHAKGHLFRIMINEDGLVINKDKDKKDPASKVTALAKGAEKFASGQWYTLQVEVLGDKVVVQSDNGLKLEGKDAALAVEKTGYRFVTRGESLLIDDVMIWEVE